MENTMKANKMRTMITGIITGFAVGVMWELVIICPMMSDWTLRSILVALTVSGVGCAIAGSIFAYSKIKKDAEKKEKVEVIA